MRLRVHTGSLLLSFLLGGWTGCFGLNPQLELSQYGHTSRTVRDGFSPGSVYAMAQTPDGYLWLGGEFGLFRFDGVHFAAWHPPAGQGLPGKGVYSLLVTQDGTLWIGTFEGLASWSGGRLTRYNEFDGLFVTSLLEDHAGTVWAGTLATPAGELCAIRTGRVHCYRRDGAFGFAVWGVYEDSSGALWASAESGLWRWKPGPAKHYPTPKSRISDLSRGDQGHVLIAMSGAGLMQVAGDKIESYPIRGVINPKTLLPDKLLRDRNGGLWIGTVNRGLIHVHDGQTDVFTKSDGLSGNTSCSLSEDREGNGSELNAHPANGSLPALRVTVEGEPRNLHPILRYDVFKIAAEALRNAFRHAQANPVEVEIRYGDQQFRLRVRDDGRGMDATAVLRQEPEGHFGVSGMQERAALARGKLVIWSTPGAGTEVELRIPAGAAYARDLTGSLRSRTLAGKA